MKTVELFSGSKSFSKVATKLGHSTFTVDNISNYNPDLCISISELKIGDLPKEIDVLWASPPCTTFSVASMAKHWNYDKTPKTESAKAGLLLVKKTLEIIKELKPKYWFIENPRGLLRKFDIMKPLHRKTVTYCRYGDTRMKPTDIWTNLESWNPRELCKNGNKDHISAPRGSKTGTQGLKGSYERSQIPEELFIEIFNQLK